MIVIAILVLKRKWWTFQLIRFKITQYLSKKNRKRGYEQIYSKKCFIASDESESSFVKTILKKFKQKYKMLAQTNCSPGNSRMTFCTKAVDDSEKTVVILTNDYIKDPFNHFVFECSVFTSVSRLDNHYLIIIVKGTLETKYMTSTMLKWLAMHKYIEYVDENVRDGHNLFWKKLEAALAKAPKTAPPFIVR